MRSSRSTTELGLVDEELCSLRTTKVFESAGSHRYLNVIGDWQFSFEITPGKGSTMAFELYTQGARRVIFLARKEALRYGSPCIESEHLLLGILRENEKVGTRIAGQTVPVAEVRKEVEALTTVRQPVTAPVEVPLSADSKLLAPLGQTTHVQMLTQGLYRLWAWVQSLNGETNPLIFRPAVRLKLSL